MTPLTLFDLFNRQQWREAIFKSGRWHFPGFRKYRTPGKLAGLTEVFRQAGSGPWHATDPLGEIVRNSGLATEIVFCTFDYDRQRARFIRSNSGSLAAGTQASQTAGMSLVEAVHASSTAPVRFFDAPAVLQQGGRSVRFWDGAVGGYNNPVMAGVVEAIANHPERQSRIRALSLGTGSVSLPMRETAAQTGGLYKPRPSPGLLTDIGLLAAAIVDDPPDAASFMAHVMLGGRLPQPGDSVSDGPVVRLSPLIQPLNPSGRDDGWQYPKGLEREFDRLTTLELDAVQQADVDAIKKLTALWLQGQVSNQAIRANGNSLHCEIGHADYPTAVKAWQTLDNTGGYPHPDNTRILLERLAGSF